MALEWFQQGPMSFDEAERLAARYRKAGRDVNVIEWFNPGERMVNVRLPALHKAPRPSRTYQQKLWK
jgi:hypothetical protein